MPCSVSNRPGAAGTSSKSRLHLTPPELSVVARVCGPTGRRTARAHPGFRFPGHLHLHAIDRVSVPLLTASRKIRTHGPSCGWPTPSAISSGITAIPWIWTNWPELRTCPNASFLAEIQGGHEQFAHRLPDPGARKSCDPSGSAHRRSRD